MESVPANLHDVIADLYENEILEEGFRYYGAHGTPTEETAESILKEGILYRESAHLGKTCMALVKDPEHVADSLENYYLVDGPVKYIVIVSYKEGLHDFDTIIQNDPTLIGRKPMEGFNPGVKHPHRIPPQFIKGYLDLNKAEFVRNLLYDSQADSVWRPSGK